MLVVDPPLLFKCLGMGPTGACCPHRIVPIRLVMPLDRGEWFGVVLEGELCGLVESMLVVDPPLLRKCLAMGPIGARCPCSIVPMGLGMPLDRGEWSMVILEGEPRELVESMLVVDPPLLRKCREMGPIGARCPHSIVPIALGVPLGRGE